MTFRDDDVSYQTELIWFQQVHNLFKEAIMLHTIALICKDIEKNQELIDFIKKNNIDVQVHCWEHYDLTTNHVQANIDLNLCVNKIEEVFGERPTVLYPPWNKTDERLEAIAKDIGLTVSTEKVSLDQYIRVEGAVKEEVVNFHYWNYEDIIRLEKALEIYNSKR